MFLVFDVTKLSSFGNIKTWIEELREHVNPNIVIMLVGNKTTLTSVSSLPKWPNHLPVRFHPCFDLCRYETLYGAADNARLRLFFFFFVQRKMG